jgi:hypothetical protein
MSAADTLTAEDFPALFRSADRSSLVAQRRFLTTTGAILILIAFAALMGAVAGRWSGWVGAVAFLVAIVMGALAVTQNLERTWYDGRALAESAKTLTWLYLVRGGEFGDGQSSPDDAFKANLRELRGELASIDFVVREAGVEITPRMRELRSATLEVRRDAYVKGRIEGQIEYYRRRSAEHGRDARLLFLATWTAQAVGLVGAVLKATAVLDFDLLGVGAAAAASLTAWLQARDHVTLQRAYELTADELDLVREDVPSGNDEGVWGAFAAEAEAAISREHVMWVARRGRRP